MLTITNTHSEVTQRGTAAKLTILTQKIATQLHLVADSCTICSSQSRRPVQKHSDTPSYIIKACTLENINSNCSNMCIYNELNSQAALKAYDSFTLAQN